ESREKNVPPRENGRGLARPHRSTPSDVLVFAEYCGEPLVGRNAGTVGSAKSVPGGVRLQTHQTEEQAQQSRHSAIVAQPFVVGPKWRGPLIPASQLRAR